MPEVQRYTKSMMALDTKGNGEIVAKLNEVIDAHNRLAERLQTVLETHGLWDGS